METKTKVVLAGAVAALCLAATCGRAAYNGLPTSPAVEQTEAPDGDCDAGDLRESKPDPDCGGLWLGTPTPGAKKTAPAKTPGPRTTPRKIKTR